MKYLLDTNTVSYALRGAGQVGEAIRARRPSELAVSAITVAELRYGACKRGSKKLHDLIGDFFSAVNEVPFDSRAAACYGEITAALEARGEPIGMADTLIAGHALALGLILVTHNLRHFERVARLELIDWFEG